MGAHFFEYGIDRGGSAGEYHSGWYFKFYGRCEFVAVIQPWGINETAPATTNAARATID